MLIRTDDDWILDNVGKNIQQASSFLKESNKKIFLELDPKVTLYEFPSEYVVIDENNEYPRIIYYMEYDKDWNNSKVISEVNVWKSETYTDRVSKHIFFDVFLPKYYDIIITDYFKNDDGDRFWADRIGEALNEYNLFIYYMDYHPYHTQINKILKRINNIDELKQISRAFLYENEMRRLIISNKQLRSEKYETK